MAQRLLNIILRLDVYKIRAFRKDRLFIVDNYLEAVGVMAAIKSGVSLASIRRPLPYTKVVCRKLLEKIHKDFTKSEPIKI